MAEITAELILHAYAQGIFPMAESASSDNVYWVDPEQRGIIPLDDFHLSRKLTRKIHQNFPPSRPIKAKIHIINDSYILSRQVVK